MERLAGYLQTSNENHLKMEEEMLLLNDEKSQEKKPRKRLKRLCGQIREQVEFYFSDANLQKDRYLKGQVLSSTDGYIDLEIIAKFNRLKAITEDTKLIAKALTTSKLIEISQDGKKIKRKNNMNTAEDTDSRTIYVECLPPDVDHEWVKNVFKVCGNVVYVSLPKFKTTGDLKGFGFVEFETQEGAEKACQEMNNPPVSAPEKPGMFPKTSKQLKQLQKQVAVQMPELLPTVGTYELDARHSFEVGAREKDARHSFEGGAHDKDARHSFEVGACDKDAGHSYDMMPQLSPGADESVERKKRKKKNSCSSIEEGENDDISDKRGAKRKKCPSDENRSPTKKLKSEIDSQENDNKAVNKDIKDSRKRCNKLMDDEKEIKRVRISEQVTVKKIEKKKRKGKKKKKGKEIPELRVISKKEWLDLKHEYLSIQKMNMNALKNALKKQTQEKPMKKTNVSSKPMEFTADVIVKINTNTSTTRKTLKDLLSMVGEVVYVDFQDGDSSGFVRCANEENARIIANAELSDITLEMVTGTEEKRYWEKILADRDRKLNSKTKSKPKRKGKQKLLDKVEKWNSDKANKASHIMFDD